MPKISLEDEDLQRLFDAINNSAEPSQELIPKLFPSFADKLRQEGKFDFEGLTKFRIPTIEYAGKRPEGIILASASILGQAAPLQVIRRFGEPGEDGWQNMIVQGDNLQFLKTCYLNQDTLIKDKVKKKIKLIYIDPPFATKGEFKGSGGERSYADSTESAEFIEALRERLIFLRELLAEDGSIYLHLDSKMSHYLKIVMDEVFGKGFFINEIIWHYRTGNLAKSKFQSRHDCILFYSKTPNYKFRALEEKLYYFCLYGPGVKISFKGPHDSEDEYGEYKVAQVDDVWDISAVFTLSKEHTSFPTQKPEVLLERILLASSDPGDLIMDVFAGSGTTAAVAEKLGRRWIMCDFGKHAIYTMQKRLLSIAGSKALGGEKKNEKYGKPPKPFSIVSVGAYDFTRVMDLRKNKDAYISFVLALFGIPKEEKDFASKYRLDSIYAEKEGDPVEIFPVWDDEYLYNVRIDEDYLKEIVVQSRGRLKGNFYIIVPENCTVISDMTLPNSAGDYVNFRLLKFPYKILEEIARNFAIEEQPDSAANINNLVSSVGFYFNNEVSVSAKKKDNGIIIESFKTLILNKEGKVFDGFDGLSLVLIDFTYDGKVFNLGKAVYAKEIGKSGEIEIDGITDQAAIIAIDKHGNESKPTYVKK